ncbi:MAG: hypothetical protein Q8S24_00020 [Eubacteriales bacterium]|nr:hypothetical protein [Eubacteriales bacterium]
MAKDKAQFNIMVDDPRLKKELLKLKKIFKEIEPDRKNLVDRLLENAAFMQVLLMDLQEDININGYREEYKNGENQFGYKRSIAADLYQVTIKNYSSVIRQLEKMMLEPPEIPKEDPAEEILKFAFGVKNNNIQHR